MPRVQPCKGEQNNRKQGKLNPKTIFRELTAERPKKLYEIAISAGSKAKSKKELATAITQKVANSSEIQLRLEEWRNEQKQRALKRVLKAESLLDYDKLSETPDKLGNFIIQNERLLQESIKQTSENENEKDKFNTLDNLTTVELQHKIKEKQDRMNILNKIIEGEIVE